MEMIQSQVWCQHMFLERVQFMTVFYYTFYGLNLLCYLGVSMHLQCKFLSERKSDVYLEYKVQYLKGT